MKRQRLKVVLPIAVLMLGVLGMVGFFVTRPEVEVQEAVALAPRVRVVEAALRTVRLSVETQGTVAPRTESELVPEVSGPVVWVSPSFVSGGFFETGDVLLEVDARDYEVTLERARATQVRAESEHARARKELARLRTLQQKSVASTSQVDDAENAERVSGAALREAEAVLAQAERDLERTRIRAPFTGRVREERVGVGQFVNRGAAVAVLYATDVVEVRLPIPDRQLAYLELPVMQGDGASDGHPAVTLRAEFAGAEHSWQGRIHRTEGEIDPRSRMVHVVARVEKPYERAPGDPRPPLAVGLFVRAEIEGREVPGAIALPRAALHEDRVWVVDEGDRLRRRDVRVLRAGRDEVLISGGLEPGERVVVSPLETPVDGMAVRPATPPEPTSLAGTGARS